MLFKELAELIQGLQFLFCQTKSFLVCQGNLFLLDSSFFRIHHQLQPFLPDGLVEYLATRSTIQDIDVRLNGAVYRVLTEAPDRGCKNLIEIGTAGVNCVENSGGNCRNHLQYQDGHGNLIIFCNAFGQAVIDGPLPVETGADFLVSLKYSTLRHVEDRAKLTGKRIPAIFADGTTPDCKKLYVLELIQAFVYVLFQAGRHLGLQDGFLDFN